MWSTHCSPQPENKPAGKVRRNKDNRKVSNKTLDSPSVMRMTIFGASFRAPVQRLKPVSATRSSARPSSFQGGYMFNTSK